MRNAATPIDDTRARPDTPAPETSPPKRRPYRKPHLYDYGDVRDTTFGASPGIGDSANPALLKH